MTHGLTRHIVFYSHDAFTEIKLLWLHMAREPHSFTTEHPSLRRRGKVCLF